MGGLWAVHHLGTQSELDELCLKQQAEDVYCITSPGKSEEKKQE